MRMSITIGLAMLLAACSAPSAPKTDTLPKDFALRSAAITLPADRITLPPAAEIVTINCSACHSPEMILSQPALDAATWQKEIDKMRTAYHASIDPEDDKALVAALMTLQAPAPAPR